MGFLKNQSLERKTRKTKITPDLQSLIEEEEITKVRVIISYEHSGRKGVFYYLENFAPKYKPLTGKRVCATLTKRQISQLGHWRGIKEITPDWDGLYQKT